MDLNINIIKKRIMSIWKKIKKAVKKLLGINDNEIKYELVTDSLDTDVWDIVPKGPSMWNKFMGDKPEKCVGQGFTFKRFKAVRKRDTYHTSGYISKELYGDGKIEVVARFKGGNSSWPAIWLSTRNGSNNYDDYYEIDLSEYYEKRPETETTYHNPKSMRDVTERMRSIGTKIKAEEWNTFTAEWNEAFIKVSINGKTVFEFKNNGKADEYPLKEEQRKFWIILSMQYGNDYLEPPIDAELPLYMDVKSFKYWKKC